MSGTGQTYEHGDSFDTHTNSMKLSIFKILIYQQGNQNV